MSQVSGALRGARLAIEHPQCGQVLQRAVAAAARPFGDSEALAILLAVPHHPGSNVAQKTEAEDLLAVWEAKCGHWRGDHLNAHKAVPELPANYRDWQPYLVAALNSRVR